MSPSATIEQLQTPQWEPIYHQELIFPSDQMTQKIFSPGEMPVKEQSQTNLGTDLQETMHYFGEDSDQMKARKKRNPFLYDFFPLDPIIPEEAQKTGL